MYLPPLSFFVSRSNRKGFALPLTLIIGLVMLTLGTVMIARGRDENVRARTTQNTTLGRGITEAGIAQYQRFFQDNRNYAYYPSSRWGDVSTTLSQLQTCGTTNTNNATAKRSTNWQALDPNDPKKGQYRLVRYDYAYTGTETGVTEGKAPGVGTLVIEGRGAANLDPSSSANASSVSTSRIEVTIPVEPRTLTNNIPGVWLTQGDLGGNAAAADVLVNDCNAVSTVNITGTDPTTNEAYKVAFTTMQFPALPTVPNLAGTGRSTQILGTLTGQNYTFPRTGGTTPDIPVNITRTVNGQTVTLSNVYEYIVDDVSLQSGNNTITITPGAKVIFYLRGSIRKGSELLHDCTGSSTCKATDFQIYGYGNLPGNSSYEICLTGNDKIEAFILAPNYDVGVAGSGGGAGGVKGSIWAKDWSNNAGCGSNTSNTVVTQTGRWEDLGLQPENLPPQVLQATDWKQKEVSP
ncbi:hypothetical protein V0288_12590 [Pannus brasiliensis CCIBt3594]|uniref:DUF7305 domain-containing protein n=1 Tax=Pannus brasiliensis CCIBt3594 TaxID=1427578 RepID=A0AAW9QWA5_9CHRO